VEPRKDEAPPYARSIGIEEPRALDGGDFVQVVGVLFAEKIGCSENKGA
jgi:hypothetical protein